MDQRQPGYNTATFFGGLWDDEPAFLIWTDAAYSDSFIHSATHEQSGRFSGYLQLPHGKRLDWECEVSDAQSELVISGTAYDLRRGSLFLVVQSGRQSSVRQIDRDVSEIGHSRQRFEEWCQSGGFRDWYVTTPEIRNFFTTSMTASQNSDE